MSSEIMVFGVKFYASYSICLSRRKREFLIRFSRLLFGSICFFDNCLESDIRLERNWSRIHDVLLKREVGEQAITTHQRYCISSKFVMPGET